MTKTASERLYGLVGEMFGPDGIAAKDVAAMLDRHAAAGVKELDLYLSSDGGSVVEGLAIYAQIQRFPGAVTVHVDGRALSIASVIALAGKRLVMPASAMLMIHEPSAPLFGNAAKLRKAADDLDVMCATMRGIYVAATGLPEPKVRKLMADETWLTATEAKRLGFVDEVTSNGPATASADRSPLLDSYRNTPEGLRAVSVEAAIAKLEGLLMRQRMQEIARSASAATARLTPGGTK